MKKPYKISIVGAGSRYTCGILAMLACEKDRFPLSKITLYDNETERQDIVLGVAKILYSEYYPECEVIATTDPKEAFEDIDFALMQIRAGRMKMRESDEHIALKHGRIGQETCGAGGFAYGMRSVPAVCDIIKDIRKYSPEAWVLNYSNPAAIVAEATKRVFKDDFRIINICDMPIGIMDFYAKALNKDVEELEPRYFGLNHFGWFTKILDKKTGEDYLPKLQQLFREPLAAVGSKHPLDGSWMATFRFMSTMICDYEDFLPNTYLQYYLYPDHMLSTEDPNHTRANEIMEGSEKNAFEMFKKIIEKGTVKGTMYEPTVDNQNGHSKYICDLATAIANNTGDVFLVMTENKGAVSNLSEGMMVEVPCHVGINGVEPICMGEAPTFHKGLLENQYAYEKLTVDACLEGSYKKAWQALTLNRCVNDTQVAKAILDDYIEANKGYWPELK